jgi:hypothetical protein
MGESLISPENFKRPILAKMNKLSNKGWSFHLRLLKMDQHALTYYRNVPKDFDGTPYLIFYQYRKHSKLSIS